MGLLNYKIVCAGFPTGVENTGQTSKFDAWQSFPNNVKGWGKWKFLLGEFSYQDGGNLRRSDFYHLNFFESQKQYSVNSEHLLKSKLA